MAKIPQNHIHQLRSAGLFVSEPWASTHIWPDHVMVGKPIDVKGNSIAGYETSIGLGDQRIDLDAPPIRFFSDDGKWFVLAEEYCPGPGPGDFLDEWRTPEEAVDDILDFYFGDPRRMQKKEEARKHPVRSPQSDTDSNKATT